MLQLVLGIIPSIFRDKKSGWTTLREEVLAKLADLIWRMAENFKIERHWKAES